MKRPTGLSCIEHAFLLPVSIKHAINMSLKEKIIHESMKLFSLKGFLSTSIDEILLASNSSKGGFYNHFKSKEELFLHVLDEARRIWRERNLEGLSRGQDPIADIKRLLVNFRDRYLKDAENFPGGCIFITLLVELKNQSPHLADEINTGFIGLKSMIKRLLEQGKALGKLRLDTDTEAISEMLFNGILGTAIAYNGQKSETNLNLAIDVMIDYVEDLEV
jgi:TetR/AcrR family transcriptional repressor of nem operon